jgi:hypothetical protein
LFTITQYATNGKTVRQGKTHGCQSSLGISVKKIDDRFNTRQETENRSLIGGGGAAQLIPKRELATADMIVISLVCCLNI